MTTRSVFPYRGAVPHIPESATIAPGAKVIGQVTLGEDVGVWFNSVLRGDVQPITIGDRTNIQELVMVHATTGVQPTVIGDDVTVGHRAILHGCTVGNGCLIGMGSIVLDEVELGDHCLVAAGAVLTPGKKYPAGSVIMGTPGKVVRQVNDADIEAFLESAKHYVELMREYRSTFDGVE